MNRDDVLRWEAGFRAACREERRLIRYEGVNCERSIRLALSLIEAAGQKNKRGVARADDRVWEREVKIVRERWCQLKKVSTG